MKPSFILRGRGVFEVAVFPERAGHTCSLNCQCCHTSPSPLGFCVQNTSVHIKDPTIKRQRTETKYNLPQLTSFMQQPNTDVVDTDEESDITHTTWECQLLVSGAVLRKRVVGCVCVCSLSGCIIRGQRFCQSFPFCSKDFLYYSQVKMWSAGHSY